MQERRLAVYRTARYYTLGAGPAEEAWVVCHGYGQLARYFLRHFEAVAAPGRLVVAPEALSRFYMDDADGGGTYRRVGASWMTRDAREDEVADYTRWLDAAFTDALERVRTPAPPRLVAFGFSQGCATVARWLAASPMLPPHRCARLILWGSALPEDLDLGAHAGWLSGRLTLVVGDDDAYATPERVAAQEERLRAQGIAYVVERFAGGHRLDPETLRRIAAGA